MFLDNFFLVTIIKKINERYPHFDAVITADYMSRPVVNKIVKDIVIYSCFFFFGQGSYIRGGGGILGVCY